MEKVDTQPDSLRIRNGQWLREHQRSPSVSGGLILVAEDSEADIFFLFRVMDQAGVANPVFVVRDGKEALAYLQGTGRYADREEFPIPAIVLLDLKLPGVDGFEILRWRRQLSSLQNTLFVAVSTYHGVYQINLAYESGADTFLSKPLAAEDILNLITSFQEYWELVSSTREGLEAS